MSDDSILDQLDNDGNVIGYQPELEYKKDRTATGVAISEEDKESYDPEKDTTLYSKTLNGFAENMPSNVLDDINYVLNNIARLKNKLAKAFKKEQVLLQNPLRKDTESGSNDSDFDPNGILKDIGSIDSPEPSSDPYNPYKDIGQLISAGETGDDGFTGKFEDQYDKINGSVIPSLINKMAQIEKKLDTLSTSFKNVFYGDPNITLPEAKQLDASTISQMKLRERTSKKNGINYLTTSFDALLNKVISHCVYQDNKSAIKVAKVIDSHETPQATSNDMNILTKLFEDVEKQLDIRARGYMRNKDFELIQKAMYNYYEKRKYLNDLYNLYNSNPNSKFLGRTVMEYSNNLNDAIKNVARVLLYDQNYLNQITDLEMQKYNIQKISRTTSSNS